MASILFNQFNGIADSKWSGIKGAFYKMVGIDIHSTPGTITVQQALAKDSGSTVTELCRVSISVSTGDQLWFSYTSGKIWRRDSSGTWTQPYTTSPAAGNAGCLGAIEYNGYVYWATQSRLHRVQTSDLAAFSSASANWQTFTNTDSEFHPMIVQNGKLIIGDGNNVATVDSTATFTAAFWSPGLVSPLRVKTIAPFGIDVVIGTIITQTVNFCQVVRWDTIQTTWQYANPLEENGINALIWIQNHLIAQAGTAGNLYAFDGQQLQPYKRIPGTWTPAQFGEVYPSAVGTLRGIPLFGFSNSPASGNTTGNPADQGIYTVGTYSKDYPRVLNGPSYVISQNKTSNVEIGAILVEGNNLYVSWKDNNSGGPFYGVDKLDWSNKYTSAYLEGLVITANPEDKTIWEKIFANYSSLPTNTSLTFKYKVNHAGSYTSIANANDSTLAQIKTTNPSSIEARAFQFRIEFTVSGNNAPIIEEIGLSYLKLRRPRNVPFL